jgi:hypothetical protein
MLVTNTGNPRTSVLITIERTRHKAALHYPKLGIESEIKISIKVERRKCNQV